VRHTVAVYERMLGFSRDELVVFGSAVGDAVGRRWPDLVNEVEGIAAGAGVRTELLLAVNARTELLGPRAACECSVAGVLARGDVRVVQNWDWHPDLAASSLVWRVDQEDGRWFSTLTEAGIVAKLGVSSAGLCVGLNFLTCSLDGGVGGDPIHVLLRVLLDRCDGLLEALALLGGASVTASSCVTLGWADDGEAALAAVELSPGGSAVLWPDARGRLEHTNHFRAPLPGGEDTQPAESPSTLLRLDVLRRADEAEAALRSHLGRPQSVCRHDVAADAWEDRRATLASVAMDPGRGSFRVAAGPPCSHALEERVR